MAMPRAGQRLILVASERLPEAIETAFMPAETASINRLDESIPVGM